MAALYPLRRPQVQMVVSDGLNANALNEQLRGSCRRVRRRWRAGHHVGERDVVVRNGRVRAGYEIGGLAGADVVVHLIGERPGTGLNTLSAYLTYGRDAAGAAALEPRARTRLRPPSAASTRGASRPTRPSAKSPDRGAGGRAAPIRRGARSTADGNDPRSSVQGLEWLNRVSAG